MRKKDKLSTLKIIKHYSIITVILSGGMGAAASAALINPGWIGPLIIMMYFHSWALRNQERAEGR